MASGINIEWLIGAVIGWYISSNFLAGPVSSIASQLLSGASSAASRIGAPRTPAATTTRGYGA